MLKKANNPNGNAHRVITFLTRDELDFLDKIGKDALFSAGTKLSRSKIISAIVNVIRKIDIDGSDLRSKRDLENRIIKAMKNLAESFYGKTRKKLKSVEKEGENNEPDN